MSDTYSDGSLGLVRVEPERIHVDRYGRPVKVVSVPVDIPVQATPMRYFQMRIDFGFPEEEEVS